MTTDIAGRRNTAESATNSSVALNASTFTTVVPAKSDRLYLYMFNPDVTNSIIVSFSTAASGVDETSHCIEPRKELTLPIGDSIYTGEVSAITTAGTFNVMFCEF